MIECFIILKQILDFLYKCLIIIATFFINRFKTNHYYFIFFLSKLSLKDVVQTHKTFRTSKHVKTENCIHIIYYNLIILKKI